MRYNESENLIEIGIFEFVATARRGISPLLPKDEYEPKIEKCECNSCLTFDFTSDGYSFRLISEMPTITDNTLYQRVKRTSTGTLKKEEKAQSRGEGYIAVKMLVSVGLAESAVTLNTDYINDFGEITHNATESVSADAAERFFEKCRKTLAKHAEAEIERVKERLPSMKSVRFPFCELRLGQSEFIKAAYRTIGRGGELYSAAPTGTGKTVSALFPAIRALGNGLCDKVFYLTPKTTTAKAASDLISSMARDGLRVRSVILIAKERLCQRGLVCRQESTDCESGKKNSLYEAVNVLFDKRLSVVTPDDIKRTARDFSTCPYELALAYSELCDIIICDFNYLFDPDVYIRRFFTNCANYCFLVDEAHNLPDRAREMYSAEISLSYLRELAQSEALSPHSATRAAAEKGADALEKLLYPYIKDDIRRDKNDVPSAAYHTRSLPGELFSIIGEAEGAVEEELQRLRCAEGDMIQAKRTVKDCYYRLKKLSRVLSDFDDGYEMFIFLGESGLTLKLFCIDPSRAIRRRLDLGKSAIFFSATLSPITYYRDLLGGDRSSTVLNLDSPFAEEQLSVCVMDKISTRYSEREDTLLAVCRAIAATLSAKRGNYMIFSPSFAYSEALYKIFAQKYPKIHSIIQRPGMTQREKDEFLESFRTADKNYLVAFCVMGGIYSEGIDLVGDRLIGAVVVGIGMPALSFEREAISAYYEEKCESGHQYAYIYPGMNRVLQAAGRVIRSEHDRGVIVLIDDRFDDPIYKKTAPALWHGMKFLATPSELKEELEKFWNDIE